MLNRLLAVVNIARSPFESRRELALENPALRQQLAMLQPSVKRPRVWAVDHMLRIMFARCFYGWRTMLHALHHVLLALRRDRREIMRFNVTAHPTAQRTTQQIVAAFPFATAPRYLLRDRDSINGKAVQRRIESLVIEEVITAPRSAWQTPSVGRVIGSIRRDCLGHVIVLNERHLRRILRKYFSDYHTSRTHLSLNKDPPKPRKVEPPESGKIVPFPRVGGLHHRCARVAA